MPAKWPTLISAILVLSVNVSVVASLRLPFLGPALGFWFMVIQPVYLLYTSSLLRESSAAERLGYSLAAVLLYLMLAGLGVNSLLPLVGVRRPLDPITIVVLVDTLTIGLYFLRQRFPGPLGQDRPAMRRPQLHLEPEERRLIFGSTIFVALAILGANRLNNGAGDQVSLAALGVSVVTLVFLLRWQRRVRETAIGITIYLLALGLLLMTSLRGWFVTGHDIQTEFQVFQLTEAHARWDIAAFHNTYNACLSITILPTELGQVLQVQSYYIYKFFFQVLFAVCPVLVYAIARRYWPVPTAILAAVYFISFPTFFADMPFLNRQEIAFLFVCVAILSITNDNWSRRMRQVGLLVACVGVEISHYSSMYILLGIFAVAWVVQRIIPARDRFRPAREEQAPARQWATVTKTVGAGSLLVVASVVVLWGFLATQTAGSVVKDAEASLAGLFGHSKSVRAGNVGYGLLFWRKPSLQTVLNEYGDQVLRIRQTQSPSAYLLPPSVMVHYSTPVSEPLLPLTAAGRLLSDIGIPVRGFNTAVRLGAAEGEQLFVGIGLLAFLFVPRLKRQLSREFFYLCAGSTVMLVVVTALPNLSVDYGILRVFQEALILIAPVLVTGSMIVFRPLRERGAQMIATIIAVGIFISTTGLLPQVLGGYPAQLSLNNSGTYYDSYYMHPQEEGAVRWLAAQPGILPAGVQASFSPSRFLLTDHSDVNGTQFIGDIYPLLVRPATWVILDYSVLHSGRAAVSFHGDLILYKYPTGFLRTYKNLVFNNGGAEIYR